METGNWIFEIGKWNVNFDLEVVAEAPYICPVVPATLFFIIFSHSLAPFGKTVTGRD